MTQHNSWSIRGIIFLIWLVFFIVNGILIGVEYYGLPLWLSSVFIAMLTILLFKQRLFYPHLSRLMVIIVACAIVHGETQTQHWNEFQALLFTLPTIYLGMTWLGVWLSPYMKRDDESN